MKAYAIFLDVKVDDPVTMGEYRKHVTATIEAFQGKFIVRGGNPGVAEGAYPYERTVIVEFPSRAQAEAWYNSPAYQRIIPFRAQSIAVIVDGVE